MSATEYIGKHRRRITMSDEFRDRSQTQRIGKHRAKRATA